MEAYFHNPENQNGRVRAPPQQQTEGTRNQRDVLEEPAYVPHERVAVRGNGAMCELSFDYALCNQQEESDQRERNRTNEHLLLTMTGLRRRRFGQHVVNQCADYQRRSLCIPRVGVRWSGG